MKEFVMYIVMGYVLHLLVQIDSVELQNTGEFWDNCTSDDQCNPASFLRCWMDPGDTVGICYCRDEFHYEDLKCRVQAEESCSVNPDCVKLSTCTTSGADKICKCNPGYKSEKSSTNLPAVCKALYDTPCDSFSDCHYRSGLGCTSEKVCKCYSTFTIWSQPDGRCLKQVSGGVCEIENEERECVHGAYCKSITEGSNYGDCRCAPAYQVTRGYFCQLEFGAICKPVENEFSEQCNSDRHFKCGTGGKCECSSDKMIFDTECKVKPGGECDLDSNEDIPWSFRRKCISKAVCERDGGTSKVGICKCVKSSGDMCELSGGSAGNYWSKSLTGFMFLVLAILNVKM